jgi:DNA modification methylase
MKKISWPEIRLRYESGEKPAKIAADYALTSKQVRDKAYLSGWEVKNSTKNSTKPETFCRVVGNSTKPETKTQRSSKGVEMASTDTIKTISVNVAGNNTLPWAVLKGYERNTLKVAEGRDIKPLKAAMVNRGFNFPVYIWADHLYIIDGAGRMEALAALESDGYVIPDLPIVEIQAANMQEAKALVLQASSEHGRVSQASYNEFVLDLDMSELMAEISFPDIKLTDIVTILPPAADPDATPPVPKDAFTLDGDLYEIGAHRLMCGDSTMIDGLEALLDGKKADMVFTDPPYGVDYKGIHNDDRDGLEALLDMSLSNCLTLAKEGAPIYMFHSDRCADIFHSVFRKYCHFSSMIIWVKPALVLPQTDYQSKHEPCFYGWFPGKHVFYADRKQTSVWEYGKERVDGHTTPKPVDLVSNALENSSKEGDLVLDLFGGSGSTMVAAQLQGRRACLMELSPNYCDVIVARMRKLFPSLPIKRNGIEI